MRKTRPDTIPVLLRILIPGLVLAGVAWGQVPAAPNSSDMLNTKHNLSVSGTGTTRALTETRICVFCHTPHNAEASSPLWNKGLEPQTYQVYASPTSKVVQKLGITPQPSGPTKLCLSCHDGTIALGLTASWCGIRTRSR